MSNNASSQHPQQQAVSRSGLRGAPVDPPLNRRHFLLRTAAGAAGLAAVPCILPASARGAAGRPAPSDRINLACIGVGGMGAADINALAPYCNIVALCDVDERRAADSLQKFPGAKRYRDFRKMFDEMADRFDAVLVATPDHTHAVAAMMAIKHRKHVYCEKPLAHSVAEVRALMKAAQEYKVVTQLGNQGHSFDSIRDCVEWIQAGAIGRVHTIHCGCNAVNSAVDRLPRLKEQHPVPPTLDWDLWLGPAAQRPYHPAYLPGAWRAWTPFGNGTIGDWICHVVDPVFWALDLGAPRSITAKVKDYDPRTQGDAFPKGDVVTFEFPAKGRRGPVTLHWYSGTEPIPRPEEFDANDPDLKTGAVVIGDKGKIVYGSHGASHVRLVPQKLMDDFQRPPKTLPRGLEHHRDWIDAIRNGRKAGSDFAAYGGPLTELAMLGLIAMRFQGRKLEWDAARTRFTNLSEANQLLDPRYRTGWKL